MTYLDDLHRYEDQQQADALSTTHTDLPYDTTTTLILAGPHKGLPIDDICEALVEVNVLAGYHVVASHRTRRPWWRLFRPTPVWRVSVRRPYDLEEVMA